MYLEFAVAVFAIVATNVGTIIALYFQLDRKIDENRRETNQIISENRKEMIDIMKGITLEIKDFHDRLYSLEEKRKND